MNSPQPSSPTPSRRVRPALFGLALLAVVIVATAGLPPGEQENAEAPQPPVQKPPAEPLQQAPEMFKLTPVPQPVEQMMFLKCS